MKALGSGIGSFALRDVEVVRAGGPGATAGAPSCASQRVQPSSPEIATSPAGTCR